MAARLSSTLLRTQPDRRLAALAADGSEPAFEALVERYRRALQSYCRRLLLPADAAEDVVQQAMLSTWQALRRGTEITDVRAWLYRCTHNAALNTLRRSGYRYEELTDALRGDGAPEEDLERRTAIRQTLAGLAALPEQQREALLQTAVEGRSHEEVARQLGLSDAAVRGLVYRARTTLRAAVGAVVPSPIILWAAAAGARQGAPMAQRLGEVFGGGSAGAAALLAKGGATVLTAGALVGGAAVVEHRSEQPVRAREAAEATRSADHDAVAPPSGGVVRPSVAAGALAAGAPDASHASRGRRSSDRHGGASGRHGRGGEVEPAEVERSQGREDDRSGPEGGGGDDDRGGSSGSGPSHSGSSGSGGDDHSGSSGSGSSGSGSGGSGHSGSSDSGSGSSGSGHSGSSDSGSGFSSSGDSGSGSGSGSGGSGDSGSSGSGDSSSGLSDSGSGDSVSSLSGSSDLGSSGSGSSGSGGD